MRALLRALTKGPRAVRLRRFAAVGTATAGVQLALLWLLVDVLAWHYLAGATVAIECTIILTYILNNAWTFRDHRHTTPREYVRGLLTTNVIRGTAIPIQLGVLAALVELYGVPYLWANVVAILVSGLYRYVLDTRLTWRGV
ncbi:putative flippase GtrA [Halarchaeum solikamskense]|uniref:GtrA family protein n=1 Tax=Halarchaeum nitratireducens TaxID=489913 RepID=UPI001B3ACBF7|nr:GtrA family protein [Halarchaeum solikamskense]MBP2251779.1 putative flippase GtrA [Halarchaeum solikamskense]